MKRKILALLLVVVLSVLCLASCEIIDKVGNKIDGAFNDVMDKIDGVINPNKPHEHTYATEWSKNDTHHWHAATCEHTDLKADEAEHAYVDGVCVCGATEPVAPHEHTYATEWSKNDTHHWHAATCEHTDLKADEAEHAYVEGVCVCGATEPVAPHEHTYATEWSKNETHHWHAATCEHTDLKADEAEHAYVEGVCVCGATEPVVDTTPDGTQAKPYPTEIPGTVNTEFAGVDVWYTFTAPKTGKIYFYFGSTSIIGVLDGADTVYPEAGHTSYKMAVTEGTTYVFCLGLADASATGTASVTIAYEDTSKYETVLHEGNNTLVFSEDEVAAGVAYRKLVIENAAKYCFRSDFFVSCVTAADGTVIVRDNELNFELAAGEYTVEITFTELMTVNPDTDCPIEVSNESAGEEPGPGDDPILGESDFIVGENNVEVDADMISAGGKEYSFVADKAGNYSFTGDFLVRIFNANGDMIGTAASYLEVGNYKLVLATGSAITEAGTYKLNIEYAAPSTEADGTESNPFVIESLPFEIVKEGTFDVYYSFTATEDCAIYATKTGGSLYMFVNGDSCQTAFLKAGETVLINVFAFGQAEESYTFNLTAGAYAEEGDFERPIAFSFDDYVCEYPGGNNAEKFVWYKANIYDNGYFVINFANRVNAKYSTDGVTFTDITDATTKVAVANGDTLYLGVQSFTLAEESIAFSTAWEYLPGAFDNPYIAQVGDNTFDIPAGATEVYFKFIPTASGTLTFNGTAKWYENAVAYDWVDLSTIEVISGNSYLIRVESWEEGATTISFNIKLDEKAATEITGELVSSQVIATPGSGSSTDEFTFTATTSGKYLINVTGKDATTWFQTYVPAEDSWFKDYSFPAEVLIPEGGTVTYDSMAGMTP